MTDPENFLSRWSRRKLEVEADGQPRADEAVGEPKPNPSARPRESGDPEPQKETPAAAALDSRLRGNERSEGIDDKTEPAFDITTLPSLESIGAETDIRVFLQKGVPADLTRAALRRAWTADPAIRDFIEMAENQWDFATGKDLPGFGPLQATDDVRKMVAEIFGEGLKPPVEAEANTVPSTAETPAVTGPSEAAPQLTEPPASKEIATAPQDQQPAEITSPEASKEIVHRNQVNIAMQQNKQDGEYKTLPIRRPHGRALPE
jgi:hypothetical protein